MLLSGAVAVSAPAATPTPVTLSVVEDPVVLDTSLGHQALRNLMQCRQPTLAGKYLGLASASIDAGFTYRVGLRQSRAGLSGRVTGVDVTLRLYNRKIRIARELPPGSCSYEAALAHERQHAATDEAVIAFFRDRLKEAIEEEVARMGPIAGSEAAITATIRQRLNTVLHKEMEALQAMRQDRNRLLDSPEEYERMSHACNGEALSLLEKEEGPGWFDPAQCSRANEPS